MGTADKRAKKDTAKDLSYQGEEGEFQLKKDVPAFEQPSAAQKFSAQEFLKALRSAVKNETILPSTRAARKEAHPKAIVRNWKAKQNESPHA